MATKEGEKLLAVRVPVTLHRLLKVQSAKLGFSMADMVALALRQYLDPKRRTK